MVCAGPGGFRPAQEPLSEPTWAFCTSTWALQTDLGSQETSKRLPGPILERFRSRPGGSGSPKNTVKYDVFAVFHVAAQTTPRSSKSALGGSQKDPQEAPRSGPARPRRPPRRFQERHKRPKSAPRAPKHGFRAALAAKLGPTGTKEPPGGLPKAILELRGPVLHPPGGRFSDSFLLSESIAKAVQWAKLVQAYAQHRFTSLCNFYMWISMATDSKSRSTNLCLDGLTTFRLAGT